MIGSHGVHFSATTTTGTSLYDAARWNDLAWNSVVPPATLGTGDRVRFTCSYDNTTSQTFGFGESVVHNEWCSFFGQFVSPSKGNGLYDYPLANVCQ